MFRPKINFKAAVLAFFSITVFRSCGYSFRTTIKPFQLTFLEIVYNVCSAKKGYKNKN